MFQVLLKHKVSCLILDEPPVNVERLRVGIVRGVPMDPPVIAEDGGTGRDHEPFLDATTEKEEFRREDRDSQPVCVPKRCPRWSCVESLNAAHSQVSRLITIIMIVHLPPELTGRHLYDSRMNAQVMGKSSWSSKVGTADKDRLSVAHLELRSLPPPTSVPADDPI